MSKKPLEEAPFHIYLHILCEEGYEDDAEIMKAFYVDLLTNVDKGDGEVFTYDQVMQTPYKNLVSAAELIMNTVQREMQLVYPPVQFDGQFMVGQGAGELSQESLHRLAERMQQKHEEEKMRLAYR